MNHPSSWLVSGRMPRCRVSERPDSLMHLSTSLISSNTCFSRSFQPCASGSLSDCSCNKETGCGCSSSPLLHWISALALSDLLILSLPLVAAPLTDALVRPQAKSAAAQPVPARAPRFRGLAALTVPPPINIITTVNHFVVVFFSAATLNDPCATLRY
ncbi:hypothetical protein VP01_1096g3 [Puccinia sorghi]|uniref:Uncharacterized protein n=1 Tax=Puccinia sorghi TaxID=27349 RepID=A0A0L6VT09_9BASI|nr:hypothetical protein VP01_1096g3 [Puccinia sorghi]